MIKRPLCPPPAFEAQAALRRMSKEAEDPDKALQEELREEEEKKRNRKPQGAVGRDVAGGVEGGVGEAKAGVVEVRANRLL